VPALYHLLTPAQAAARDRGAPWIPPGYDADGFIHLCWDHQLEATVERHFAGGPVIALRVDPEKLPSGKLIDEDLYGHGSFPHLYCPLPAEAVVEERELP
jgi:uncharacterized protein (DUF952 family)